MEKIKSKLIEDARKKYDEIYPASKHKTLQESFTQEENDLIFWFNTKDGSTRILIAQIKGTE